MKFSEILFCLFCAIMISACFLMGHYFGYKEGLYNGAIEYRTCIDNKATGWYVEGAEFNCIF